MLVENRDLFERNLVFFFVIRRKTAYEYSRHL